MVLSTPEASNEWSRLQQRHVSVNESSMRWRWFRRMSHVGIYARFSLSATIRKKFLPVGLFRWVFHPWLVVYFSLWKFTLISSLQGWVWAKPHCRNSGDNSGRKRPKWGWRACDWHMEWLLHTCWWNLQKLYDRLRWEISTFHLSLSEVSPT